MNRKELEAEIERLKEFAFGRFIGLMELIESGIPENGCAAVTTIMLDIPETMNEALASARRHKCDYLLMLVNTKYRLRLAKEGE